jgi:hypothetical protein
MRLGVWRRMSSSAQFGEYVNYGIDHRACRAGGTTAPVCRANLPPFQRSAIFRGKGRWPEQRPPNYLITSSVTRSVTDTVIIVAGVSVVV